VAVEALVFQMKAWARGWQGLATEWYQDEYNSREAQEVTVTSSGVTTSIDISLEPGGSISGIVQNDTGDNLKNAFVATFFYNDPSGMALYARTGADGSYTIEGLPMDDYIVRAFSRGCIRQVFE